MTEDLFDRLARDACRRRPRPPPPRASLRQRRDHVDRTTQPVTVPAPITPEPDAHPERASTWPARRTSTRGPGRDHGLRDEWLLKVDRSRRKHGPPPSGSRWRRSREPYAAAARRQRSLVRSLDAKRRPAVAIETGRPFTSATIEVQGLKPNTTELVHNFANVQRATCTAKDPLDDYVRSPWVRRFRSVQARSTPTSSRPTRDRDAVRHRGADEAPRVRRRLFDRHEFQATATTATSTSTTTGCRYARAHGRNKRPAGGSLSCARRPPRLDPHLRGRRAAHRHRESHHAHGRVHGAPARNRGAPRAAFGIAFYVNGRRPKARRSCRRTRSTSTRVHLAQRRRSPQPTKGSIANLQPRIGAGRVDGAVRPRDRASRRLVAPHARGPGVAARDAGVMIAQSRVGIRRISCSVPAAARRCAATRSEASGYSRATPSSGDVLRRRDGSSSTGSTSRGASPRSSTRQRGRQGVPARSRVGYGTAPA